MSRRRFSERDVIETLLWQGVDIRCFRSGTRITVENVCQIEREHLHEVALDGPDIPANCRYSLKSAHAVVTNGAPATSAGSSKNRIAKTRPNRAEKFIPNKRPLDETTEIAATARCRRCGEYQADCECRTSSRKPSARLIRA